ncbi:glycosyltransferase [Chitinophaga arvensicola]|uniref:Glycosyl transferases group 1 n=1 Tax=Chitinophaga arvensicola TaxID=29529 RepID=A0A1I0S5D7_9BACT|nr:glycosyltransferase [Chitinophaga arvensicola]SEW50308.1 Glycosyl transferases group 1 [Chitinophaga arvensicola]
MISGKNIVIVGLQSWDISIGSNCKNIALELSKYNRVLYVNRAPDRISMLRSRGDNKVQNAVKSLRGEINDLQQVTPQLWTLAPRTVLESVNWIPFNGLFDFFNRINNQRIAREINKATAQLGFGEIVLFNDNDFFRGFYLAEMLNNVTASIYYIRDNLTSQAYFQKHGKRLETKLMQKSTLVAANSAWLADYGRQHNPSSFDIGQGCDFDNLPEDGLNSVPEDIAALKKPLIGYVGALISTRLDIAVLEHIATNRPDWNIVLVGPEDDRFLNSRLHDLPNIHFTGSKPPAQLPGYIAAFDVCINPQVVNDMTIGNYPRKIDEYLAMGKPVVATSTATMQLFASYVNLCNNKEAYIVEIENALAHPDAKATSKERRDFALTHTWNNSVLQLSRHYHTLNN